MSTLTSMEFWLGVLAGMVLIPWLLKFFGARFGGASA